MYIPTTFFGASSSCISASVTYNSGTGSYSSGSFVSGGSTWNYIYWENTTNVDAGYTSSYVSTLNITSGTTGQAKLLVVAGGGGGGFSPSWKFGDGGTQAASGGGGGGIVYYNNFPLSTGTYEISVGAGGRHAQTFTGFYMEDNSWTILPYTASSGKDSYFKNKDLPYTPFTTAYITARGGGAGGNYYHNGNTTPETNCLVTIEADSGGSGGGAIRNIYDNADGLGASSNANGQGGIDNANQGNRGGSAYLSGPSHFFYDAGCGGGGAAVSGSPVVATNFSTVNDYRSAGGAGLGFNLTGTPFYASGGGGGANQFGSAGTAANGTGSYGNGGAGGVGGYYSIGAGAENGTNGIVILTWLQCPATGQAPVPPLELNRLPISQSLWAYYDIAFTSSYSGTGTTITDLSGLGHTGNFSGSLSYKSTTAASSVTNASYTLFNGANAANAIEMPSVTLTSSFSMLASWYGKNANYFVNGVNVFNGADPEVYGMIGQNSTNSLRMAIGVNDVFDTTSSPISASSLNRWHVSQISFDDATNTLNYCFDGITGSTTLAAAMQTGTIIPTWNKAGGDRYLGSGSMVQVLALYTGSLSTTQLLQNHNAISGRYL
jgi:hypothetical protein